MVLLVIPITYLDAFVCIYMGSACSVFVNAVSYYLLTYLDSNFDNVG